MTTEYHDDVDDNSFWNKGPPLSARSGVSRLIRRLFPFLTAAAILILGIALGASYSRLTSRLWSVEQSVSNMSQSLSSVEKLTADAAKDVERLKFGVASAKDELRSTSEALKQLATLDTISRVVASLQCSVERIINNGTGGPGSPTAGPTTAWEAETRTALTCTRTDASTTCTAPAGCASSARSTPDHAGKKQDKETLATTLFNENQIKCNKDIPTGKRVQQLLLVNMLKSAKQTSKTIL
ncbi:uncharacterized protein asgr1a isoform X2 [Phyllopteryx taeniolatus]|uniref:uncharacterized protein asgr1a isoform X2 n=1 Tax=Phyllopteryx taeniolatus TaxID=161469 RepID=UPI002AD28CC8|nr:uncharacterized protein asgr1a isoform X2 [Phyllopteryx taeniolatus]